MDKNEFKEWFDRQVRSRWPDWPVNDITLADWFAAFAKYDKDLLTRAVQYHKVCDDPSCPGTKKLFEIIRKLSPSLRQESSPAETHTGENEKLCCVEKHQQMIRTKGTKRKRIEHILSLYLWYPKAREKDPEAYEWIVKDRLHEKLGIKYEPRTPARATAMPSP